LGHEKREKEREESRRTRRRRRGEGGGEKWVNYSCQLPRRIQETNTIPYPNKYELSLKNLAQMFCFLEYLKTRSTIMIQQ